MDYVQEIFENANQWIKENDPLKFPMVEANINCHIGPNGLTAIPGPGTQSGPSFAHSLGQNNNPASSSSSYSHSHSHSSNSFSSLGSGNSIGHGGVLNLPVISVQDNSLLKIKTFEPTRINYKFDHMGNIVNPNPNFPNIYFNIPTPKQENQNANGEKDNKEEKQQEKKQCVTTNQILVFANAGYYDEDAIKRDILPAGNEQNSKLFKVYEDKRLASKASVITTKNGVASFNIAGTADLTEEGLENFIRDSLNDVLVGTNSLQGILKDRIDWYISSIEKYNKESGNKQPLILNGHSSGGFEGIIISVLRPDLVSQVNMVDSPGAYDMVLKLVNGDKVKADEIYKKVEIYNGNRGFVNSKGSHPPGKVIHHIDVSVHAIKEFPLEYKVTGAQEILGRCHSDSFCSYKDGEYKVERLRDGVTKKEIADYFGLSEGQIEAIDNNSLSDKDLAKFQNKISSKFKFKL
jgi:hypothetical protein